MTRAHVAAIDMHLQTAAKDSLQLYMAANVQPEAANVAPAGRSDLQACKAKCPNAWASVFLTPKLRPQEMPPVRLNRRRSYAGQALRLHAARR